MAPDTNCEPLKSVNEAGASNPIGVDPLALVQGGSAFVFSSEYVFTAKVAAHDYIKQTLLPKVLDRLPQTLGNQKKTWLGEVNTEFFDSQQHLEKYGEIIALAVYPALDAMLRAMQFRTPKFSQVTEIWYNYYEAGSFQEVHSHTGGGKNVISGVYNLLLEEKNKLVVYSQNSSYSPFVKPAHQVEAAEGEIILFPSNMLHYVLPCEKPRATIAFNIDCTF
jgi:hypothetical protein